MNIDNAGNQKFDDRLKWDLVSFLGDLARHGYSKDRIEKLIVNRDLSALPYEILVKLFEQALPDGRLTISEVLLKPKHITDLKKIADRRIQDSLFENIRIGEISNSEVSNVRFNEVNFIDCTLESTSIGDIEVFSSNIDIKASTGSGLWRVVFNNCKFKRFTSFLSNSTLVNCDLTNADFSTAQFPQVSFRNCRYSDKTKWPADFENQLKYILHDSINIDELERTRLATIEEIRQQAISELSIINPTADPAQFNERAIQAMIQKLDKNYQADSEQKQFWRFQVQAWIIQLNLMKQLVVNSTVAENQRTQMIAQIDNLERSIQTAQQQILTGNLDQGRYSEEQQAQMTMQKRQILFQIFNSKLGQRISITKIGNSGYVSGVVKQVGTEAVMIDSSWVPYDDIDHAE